MFSGSIHTHSEYSRYDSGTSVKDLVQKAVELGASHMALTDHGTLIGTWDFLKACEAAEINGIPGVELYVISKNGVKREHLILLPKNYTGFQAISKIVTESNGNFVNGFPVATQEMLERYLAVGTKGHGNVIGTSACMQGVLASELLINHELDTVIAKIAEKQRKESDPNNPQFTAMKSRIAEMEKDIKRLVEEKKELGLMANKKYKARTTRAEKIPDISEREAALREIEEEQKESEAAEKRIPEVAKEISAIRKEAALWKERRDKLATGHARWEK